MSTTIEKKFNVWNVQEELNKNRAIQKQLDISLKNLRDEHDLLSRKIIDETPKKPKVRQGVLKKITNCNIL